MVKLDDEVMFGHNGQPLKLNRGKIRRIKLGYNLGFTKRELARGYGVSEKTIRKVISRESPYDG